ncbi:PilN domain-containing protein [Candidatus Parabeggiatoa sp. HSG14]|uniref:PilN domain-containing protein n=1 Tax=Candidatus Parabeggiatoa sp. HSG14 TaxID=3055593 RepID=UPI0025A75313|nr:PilN domain-containing protein [Thiotrichales bacterium HSG14]
MKLFSKQSKKRLKLPKHRKSAILSDICLIVHDTVLLHTKHHNLVAQPDESLLKLTPAELAAAAHRLLPVATKRQRIALALPSTEFVVTTLKLPAVATQNLKNVVNLQLPTLLPGVTEPLLLAVQAPIEGEQTCALWMPAKRANELFHAFDQEGLFLACILPRPIVALPATLDPCQVYDEDSSTITCLEWSNGVIQRWLHIPKMEGDNPEFEAQLGDALLGLTKDINQEKKNSVNDWEELPMLSPTAYDYAFIPAGTVSYMAQVARRKKHRHLAIFASLLVASLIGGLYFAIDYEQRLKQDLADLQQRTNNVTQLSAEVKEIERDISPLKEYPRQKVVKILETLNKLIPKDSWITSFEIKVGVLKIDGYSPNPSNLIGILQNNPQFESVTNRGFDKRPNLKEIKFGINFKLTGYDFGAYWDEYFSKQ